MHISSISAAVAAGCMLGISAVAQEDQAREKASAAAPIQIVSSDILLGAEARARNNDKIGSIKDIGVDAATGRIIFFVLTTGGVLGIGSTERVVSAKVLSCDTKDEQCVLDMTKDDFEKAAAYDVNLLDEYYKRFGSVDGNRVHAQDAAAHGEKSPTDRSEVATTTITGKVTSIDRISAADGGCVVADIVDDKNESHRIVLGPGQYLRSQGIAPVVGERIEVTAVRGMSSDNSKVLTASTVKCEKSPGSVRLRDATGRSQWERPCCVVASKLSEAKIHDPDQRVGSVVSLFCDLTHGTVAYVTLSKDYGDGEAMYLIPYRAVWMDRDQALHLASTKEPMRTAPKLSSKEGKELADPKFCSRVHEFYGVESGEDTTGKEAGAGKSAANGKDAKGQ